MMKGIILAAGKGTRMKSKYPKVVHKVAGKTMLNHVLDAAVDVDCKEISVVVGHGREYVKNSVEYDVDFVVQKKQLGTGHAVMVCDEYIEETGDVLILYGDTPLLSSDTLKKFVSYHKEENNVATVLTAKVNNPHGYGRIITDKNGKLLKIVEQKDASEKELLVNEVNSGIYCVKAKMLKECLANLNNDNAQGEYYLTDVIEMLNKRDYKVSSFIIENSKEILGVNTRKQLLEVEEVLKQRIFDKHFENGVSILDSSVYIGKDVVIGMDTKILPGAYIDGKTIIGEGCIIGPNSRIEDSKICNNVEVRDSTIIESFIKDNSFIGPYAYLRPNSKIGKNVKIGDFVEVKNTIVGDGTKVSHLSYIGDGIIGKNVNIGCGVVFVNYNGVDKNQTVVKDNAFVGCNSNLVAPVEIGEKAYVAAGSTITDNVEQGALSIARKRQVNKLNWVKKSGLLKK